jgi:hypothetical protein
MAMFQKNELMGLLGVCMLGMGFGVTGCHSSGVNGDKGVVRFSFVGNDQGVSDTAPVALNSTLRVVLQRPSSSGVDANTFTQLSLVGVGQSGAPSPQVIPSGIAEYSVFFTAEGAYQLQALQGTTVLDTVEVTVQKPDALAFASSVSVLTSGTKADGTGCSGVQSVALSGLSLAENQTATLTLRPMRGGAGLQGLPSLTADATHAALDATPSSYGQDELSVDVRPNDFGQSVTLTATDLLNQLTATATLATHTGKAACPQ